MKDEHIVLLSRRNDEQSTKMNSLQASLKEIEKDKQLAIKPSEGIAQTTQPFSVPSTPINGGRSGLLSMEKIAALALEQSGNSLLLAAKVPVTPRAKTKSHIKCVQVRLSKIFQLNSFRLSMDMTASSIQWWSPERRRSPRVKTPK
jgi:hypothetical protein